MPTPAAQRGEQRELARAGRARTASRRRRARGSSRAATRWSSPLAVAEQAVRDDSRRGSRAAAAAASCRAARSASSARTSAPCGGTRSRSSASASRTRAPRARRPRAGPRCTIRYGKREVVPEARVDLDVVAAAQRVDRAVAAGDRAEARLLLAQPELVAPVDALLVRARRRPRAAAGRRRRRRRDRRGCATSCRSASGAQVAFASENATISLVGLAHRAVLRGDLAAARAVEQADARLARRHGLDELVRPVGRRVRGDDDLELVAGIVEREQVRRAAARSPPPRCTRRRSPSPTARRPRPSRPAARARARAPRRPADSPRASTRARPRSPRRASSAPASARV